MSFPSKFYRKFLATGVATALFVAAAAPAISADQHSFPDVPAGAWYEANLEYAVDRGVIEGYTDGTFRPDGQITRAEAATVLKRAKGLDPVEEPALPFSDTDDNQWYAPYVATVVKEGLMQGDPGGTFRPDEPMSRGEFSRIMVNAYDLVFDANADISFPDLDADDSRQWYFDDVMTLASLGIIQGFTDGTFRAESNVSRSQSTAFLHRTEVKDVRLPVDYLGLGIYNLNVLSDRGLTTVMADVVLAYEEAEALVEITPDDELSAEDIENYAKRLGLTVDELVMSLSQTVEVDDDGEIEAEFNLLPPGQHTATVTIEAKEETGDAAVAETTFSIEPLVLNLDSAAGTTKMIRTEADQQLEFEVDDVEYSLLYLISQGYTVEFTYNSKNPRYDQLTGLVDASDLAHTAEFRYAVEVSKGDGSVKSPQQTVTVYDPNKATEVTSVGFDYGEYVHIDYFTRSDDGTDLVVRSGVNAFGEELDFRAFETDAAAPSYEVTSATPTVAYFDHGVMSLATGDASFTLSFAYGPDVDLEDTYQFDFEVKEGQTVSALGERSEERVRAGSSTTVTLLDQYGERLRSEQRDDLSIEVEDSDGEPVASGDGAEEFALAKVMSVTRIDVTPGYDVAPDVYSVSVLNDGDAIGAFDLKVVDPAGEVEAYSLTKADEEAQLSFTFGEELEALSVEVSALIDGITFSNGTVAWKLNEILAKENHGLKLVISDEDVLSSAYFETLEDEHGMASPADKSEVTYEDDLTFAYEVPSIEVTAKAAGTATVSLVEFEGTIYEETLAHIELTVTDATPAYTEDNLSIKDDADYIDLTETVRSTKTADALAGEEAAVAAHLVYDGEAIPETAFESLVVTNHIESGDNGKTIITGNLVIEFRERFGGNIIDFEVKYELDEE